MRDIILTLIIFGSLPFILRNAYIGVLVWSWLSYMNPHRLTWGFAYSMPFAKIVGIALIIGLVFSKDKQPIPKTGLTVIWVMFIAWMGFSTLNAIYPESAQALFLKIIKIQVVTFITIALLTNQDRINKLIWVIVVSIGYYSVKGGIFTLVTGGAYKVWGPFGSFIEENNSLALATLMIIPLMNYLRIISNNIWVKRGLLFAMGLSFASALGSQSRGALIAVVAVAFFFWLKSSNKVLTGALLVFCMAGMIAFMPQSWHERMATIQTYQEDASAMGRINSWHYSINIANDRLTGGGLQSWKPGTFALYAPNPNSVHAAHSIFFGPLGDHGWLGLIFFALILLLTWTNLKSVIRISGAEEEDHQRVNLARMIQVSMIAYMSGGAFLSLTYFDLPWHLIAIALVLNIQSKQSASLNKKYASPTLKGFG